MVIYFSGIADNVRLFFVLSLGGSIACLMGSMLGIIFSLSNGEENLIPIFRLIRNISFPSLLFCALSLAFIPSSETIYKIMIIPTVINSPIAQKLPDEPQQFIDKKLSVKDDKK